MSEVLKARGAAGAAVGVIRGGRLVWTGYYGLQGPGEPVTAETLFNVASLTKPLAAETILRLASEGRMSLDEPMHPVWVDPDLKDDPRHRLLTPALALSHRTGFSNWRFKEADGKLRFGTDPGGKPGYSGEGYDYVARFAEKKLGVPFEELVRTRVLEPVGMTSSALTGRPWMTGRVVTPMDAKGAWGKSNLREPGGWTAADDLHTTVRDYAAFMISVSKRERLTPAIATRRETIQADTTSCPPALEGVCPKPTGFALGWEILTFDGRPMLYHTGNDWGENALAYIFLETGDGAVVFVNGGGANRAILDVLDLVEDPSPLRTALHAFYAAEGG